MFKWKETWIPDRHLGELEDKVSDLSKEVAMLAGLVDLLTKAKGFDHDVLVRMNERLLGG